MKITIDELSSNLVDIDVYPISDTEVLWNSSESKLSNYFNNNSNIVPFFSAESNSYINSERFDFEKKLRVVVERYGGKHIGTNGGGARCSNYENIQYKGVGRNFLANSLTNKAHTNGTLSLLDGVVEVIYSEVLSHLLPKGVVRALSLIYTGNDTAYCNYTGKGIDKQTHGCILAREKSVRIAHFLPIPYYNNSENDNNFDDYTRLVNLHRDLLSKFQNNDVLANYLGHLLTNYSEQFAFAKVARISHGAVTASNIAFDGKWLDLNTVNFLKSGQNITTSESQVPFYQESQCIHDIFQEFVYNFCKYNRFKISSNALSKYYSEQFSKQLDYHIPWILGLRRELVRDMFPTITKYFMEIIVSDKNIKLSNGYKREKDSLLISIGLVFKDIFQKAIAPNHSNIDKKDSIQAEVFNLIKQVSKEQENESDDFINFLTKTYLIASKRAYFHQVFCRARVNESILPMIENSDIKRISDFVEEIIRLSKWIFCDVENELVTIFDSSKLQLLYNSKSGNYELIDKKSGQIERADNSQTISEFINTKDREEMTIAHFNFKEDILEILEKIPNV